MKMIKNIFLIVIFITLLGCSTNKTRIKQIILPPAIPGGTSYGEDVDTVLATKDTADVDAVTGATGVSFAVLAGASYGGFVDNSDASGIEGTSDVDAITGATKISYNAGIHSILKGHGRTIEIGLDYVRLNQSVEYALPSLSVNGTRSFELHQVRLPITYNFEFFKNDLNQAKLSLKLGLSTGYTFSKTITDSESSVNMPAYDYTNWDIGPAFGLYLYPFDLNQNLRLGLYLDFYRGRKIYEDIYHEGTFLGDNSFLNFGIVLEP